jgi:hypothetical protein
MKRWIVIGLLVALFMAMPVMAEKPAANSAGAQKVAWHLSGAVMPVPPYGSLDVPGSDTASKLIVNQPNGDVAVVLTGVMNGLNPDTEYTVYVSKGYTPYTPANVVGAYTWLVLGTYSHDLVIDVQNVDGTFSGYGGYPAGASPYATTETITGQVTGNQVTFTTKYAGPYNPGYTATAIGTIAPDGTMSGTSPWEWHMTSGLATPASGSTGWPGLLLDGVQPFTFTTDEFGSGSWHANLFRDAFPSPGPYPMSVWINGGGLTVLISDTFTETV